MLFLLRCSLIFLILAWPEIENASFEALPDGEILPSKGSISILSLFFEKLRLPSSNATELFLEPRPLGLFCASETSLVFRGALVAIVGVFSLFTSCKFSVNF